MNIRRTAVIQYVICLGSFLSNLSAGMFNIGLVDIAREFQRSMMASQWVITVYLLTITVCLPLMGSLGDLKGKRTIHNIGYFLFMAGSLGCAVAPRLSMLIGFRVLQGIGASMYQANNMALVVSLFPADRRGRALGTISTFVAAGALIGPSLGGVIVQWCSWRINFWLLASVAFGAWLLAQYVIPKQPQEGNAKLDLMGGLFFAAALTGLVTGINLGNVWGWNSAVVWMLFLGFISFSVLFTAWCRPARWQHPDKMPFIRLELFSHPSILFGIAITVATYAAAFTAQTVLPVFLRNVMHIKPALAGLIVMGYPASLILAAPLSGGSSDKFGPNPIVLTGLIGMSGSLLALSFLSSGSGVWYAEMFIVALGSSMGMITSPNNSVVMSKAPKRQLGLMSSMIALNRNLGMMLGAAAGAIVMSVEPRNGGEPGGGGVQFQQHFSWLFMTMAFLILISIGLFIWTVRRQVEEKGLLSSATQERSSAV